MACRLLLTLKALGEQNLVFQLLYQAQLAVETACLRQIWGVKIGDGRTLGAYVSPTMQRPIPEKRVN